jgi:Major intrinsic protein
MNVHNEDETAPQASAHNSSSSCSEERSPMYKDAKQVEEQEGPPLPVTPGEAIGLHYTDMAFTSADGVAVFAELIGTIMFIFFSLSAVQAALTAGKLTPPGVAPELTPVAILIAATAFGLAIMVSVAFTAKVSGGHLNPAITIAMYACGFISPIKGMLYIVAQLLGGIIGAAFADIITPGTINLIQAP